VSTVFQSDICSPRLAYRGFLPVRSLAAEEPGGGARRGGISDIRFAALGMWLVVCGEDHLVSTVTRWKRWAHRNA